MTVEEQIVKATKVKETAYKIRQDYLAALVRGIDKLSQDDWDNLSDEVVNWHVAAVGQMDKKRQIEDFHDSTGNNVVSEGAGEDAQENEPEKEEMGTSEVGTNVEVGETESDEQPKQEEVKETKSRGRPKKVKEVKPKEESRWPKEYANRPEPERYSKITGEKDRFGITIGTKTHEAVKMYTTEEGATLKQVDKAIGGRHFNILGKLAKDGHKVEKLAGGFWRITHKDD